PIAFQFSSAINISRHRHKRDKPPVNFLPAEFYYRQTGGLSAEEFTIVKRVMRSVSALTSEVYGQELVSPRGIFAAINMFRKIRALIPDRQAPVLEIGGGNGYLGALLVEAGYKYVSTDVTQSLYLFQSHLLRQTAGERFLEAAPIAESQFDLAASIEKYDAVHLPWWIFYTQFNKPEKAGVGLVVCNRALMEMGDTARLYCMHQAREMLLEHPTGRLLIFEDWGGQEMSPLDYGSYQLHGAGFKFCHYDYQNLCAAMVEERSGDLDFLDLPKDIKYRAHYPKRGSFPLPGVFEPFAPTPFQGRQINEVLNRFAAKHLPAERIPLSAVQRFLNDELEITEIRSMDEKFSIHMNSLRAG
ncbi:MAG: hypothetical protein O2985_08505, partial [Proteobacteria bacterium]|nr:hypothetical protein [Pseudomonadota bacterium]